MPVNQFSAWWFAMASMTFVMKEKKGVQLLNQENTRQWHSNFEASESAKTRISKETGCPAECAA